MKRVVRKFCSVLLAGALLTAAALPVWADEPATPETAQQAEETVEAADAYEVPADEGEPVCEEAPVGEAEYALRESVCEPGSDFAALSQGAVSIIRQRGEAAIAAGQTEVNVRDLGLTTQQVLAVTNDMMALKGGYKVKQPRVWGSGGNALYIELQYYDSAACAQMKAAAADIMAAANKGSTTLEKVLLLHNEIVLRNAYDYKNYSAGSIPRESYTPYGMLINHTSVCQGYACTFAALANEMGIPAILVTSKALGHAWNMVQVDGKWYQLDCTWDDPVMGTDCLGLCLYTDFLCSTENFQTKSHKASDYVAFYDTFEDFSPAAADTTYDSAWWTGSNMYSAVQLSDGDWYYSKGGQLCWRDTLDSSEEHAMKADMTVFNFALLNNRAFAMNTYYSKLGDTIVEYSLDTTEHTVKRVQTYNTPNYGLATYDGKVYYAAEQGKYSQSIKELDISKLPPITDAVTSSVYAISGNMLTGVTESTDAAALLANMQSDGGLSITAADGTALTGDDPVGTGAVLHCDADGSNLYIVVYGDLNGDGQIKVSDMLVMQRNMLMDTYLTPAQTKAATPVSKSETGPSSADMLRLCRYLLEMTDTMV